MKSEYYYAAAYLRLSREDHIGNVIESNSIRLQRELIDSFVQKQTDIEIYDIYIDGSDIIGLNRKSSYSKKIDQNTCGLDSYALSFLVVTHIGTW